MRLVNTASSLLEDAKMYLEQIDAATYSATIDLLFNSSIGQHSRHFIEFFQCLFAQMESNERLINYDKRLRNHEIESKPKAAIEAINELLKQLAEQQSDEQLRLEACFPDEVATISTTYGRELLYNIEHTIHHLAIIKIGLKAVAPQIQLPAHFGVAASTIKHRKEICVQ